MKYPLDERLKEWATDRQWEILVALSKTGSQRKAADLLGIERSSMREQYQSLMKKAARRGYAPDQDITHPVAPGMSSKGTSILYDGEGEIKEYWNKTKQEGRDPEEVVQLPDPKTVVKLSTLYDQEGRVTQQWVAEKPEAIAQLHAWEEFAKALAEDLPRVDPIQLPEDSTFADDLLSAYPVGDHHLGQLSWKKETKDNYDMEISEELLNQAMARLVGSSIPSKQSMIIFLGDFLHYDSFEAVTPTSRNTLDSDTRYPKMVRAGIRCMRNAITLALKKHQTVHVIVEIGNHDLASSVFLMECLRSIYENELRVTVDTSPQHFHYYRFGENLIGTHHGHGVRMPQLPLIMATDRPDDWGKSKYRYWWTGHIHHSKVQAAVSSQDYSGCSVESFRVLPPNDAWAQQKGYRPRRDMKCIVLHAEHGEVARLTVNPDMFLETTRD